MRKFLLANDDGIHAPGISALIDSVQDQGEITVIAPHQEQSGMSQAITVNNPLRLTKVDRGYMLDGTPADCVKMALQGLHLQPDFVLSGINSGSNLGTDVLYSGTVAAALEGILHGIVSIAFSLCGSDKFMPTASKVVHQLLFEKPGFLINPELVPTGGILNINIPAIPFDAIKGIRITRLGVQQYEGLMQRREDPRGGLYYWMGGQRVPSSSEDTDIDVVAVDQGYVSITPLHFDITLHKEIPRLRDKMGV